MTLTNRHKLGCSVRLDNWDKINEVWKTTGRSMGDQIDEALDFYDKYKSVVGLETSIELIKDELKQDIKRELYEEIISFLVKNNNK